MRVETIQFSDVDWALGLEDGRHLLSLSLTMEANSKKLVAPPQVLVLVFSLLKSTGDWLRGRAYPSHGWGHKFESCIAHWSIAPYKLRLGDWRSG